MSVKEKCEILRNGVLEVIVDNFDYFRENKSHLAWALMNFDLIHRASRLVYDACQDNANDLYSKLAEKLSEEDRYLFSDAWDITQMDSEGGNYRDFDPKQPVSQALLDSIASMRKKFPEKKDIYPTEAEIIKKVSFMNYGTPKAELAGYTIAEEHVNPDIKEKILALTTDSLIADGIARYKAIGKKVLVK